MTHNQKPAILQAEQDRVDRIIKEEMKITESRRNNHRPKSSKPHYKDRISYPHEGSLQK